MSFWQALGLPQGMPSTRFRIFGRKLFYFLEEIEALKDGGLWHFIGIGILLILLFPVLIFELIVLLVIGKDMGWFQSSEHVEEVMELNTNEVPESLRNLIPLAKKWGIGDDYERGEVIKSAMPRELDELEQKVGSRMQEIGDWLSGYPQDNLNDTTYFFTYLMVAYEECHLYRQRHNA